VLAGISSKPAPNPIDVILCIAAENASADKLH
jgi:hypothetical protein